MTQQKYSEKELDLNMAQMRRNPYLTDYASHKNTGRPKAYNDYNTRAEKRRAREARQRRRRMARIRRYAKIVILCAVILTGIVGIRYLLKSISGVTEAGAPETVAHAADPDTVSSRRRPMIP